MLLRFMVNIMIIMVILVSSGENGISRHEETFVVSIQQSSKITMNKFTVKINLLLYYVVNFMIIMVILVFFMVFHFSSPRG